MHSVGTGEKLCRYFVSAIVALATMALLAGTMVMSATYGGSKGTDEPLFWIITSQRILVVSYTCVEIAAALFPLMAIWAYRDRRWSGFAICVIGFVLCGSFSGLNALGFMGMSRSEASASREHDADGYSELVAERNRLKEQLEWVAKARPLDVVAAEISKMENDEKFVRTKGCQAIQITLPDSKAHCETLAALRIEVAKAGRKAELTEDIKLVNAKIQARKNVIAKDSLPGQIHALVGFDEGQTSKMIPVFIMTVILFVVFFGFTIAESNVAPVRATRRDLVVVPEKASPVQPAADDYPEIRGLTIELPPVASAPALTAPEVIAPEKPTEAPTAPEAIPSFTVPVETLPPPQRPAVPVVEPVAIKADEAPAPQRVRALPVPVPRSDEELVRQWIPSVVNGRHPLDKLQTAIDAYCTLHGIPMMKRRKLGGILQDEGYVMDKACKTKKMHFTFPKVASVERRRAKA